MLIDRIINALANLPISEVVSIYNNANNYNGAFQVYPMEEFDSYFKAMRPFRVAELVYYGPFHANDKWFYYNVEDSENGLNSFSYLDEYSCPIDIKDLAYRILDENNAFHNLTIQSILDGEEIVVKENKILIQTNSISEDTIQKAEKCLIDNGINKEEVDTVLQALGYILLDTELYPQ